MISISQHGNLDNEEAFLLHLSSQAVNSDGTATVTRVGAFGVQGGTPMQVLLSSLPRAREIDELNAIYLNNVVHSDRCFQHFIEGNSTLEVQKSISSKTIHWLDKNIDFILEKHPQISKRFPSRKGNAKRAGGASH